MSKERRSGPQPGTLRLLLLLALVGLWPLVSLGGQTTTRTWVLSVVAVALGAALGIWLRDREMRLPLSGSRTWRPGMWILAAVAPAVLIGSAPAGVRMIYSAALEGLVCAVAFYAVRARLNGRIVNREGEA